MPASHARATRDLPPTAGGSGEPILVINAIGVFLATLGVPSPGADGDGDRSGRYVIGGYGRQEAGAV